MPFAVSDQQHEDFNEIPEFELDADDSYDVRCAEAFISLSGVLVVHCSLCEKKYESFANFEKHLLAEHCEEIGDEMSDGDTQSEISESQDKEDDIYPAKAPTEEHQQPFEVQSSEEQSLEEVRNDRGGSLELSDMIEDDDEREIMPESDGGEEKKLSRKIYKVHQCAICKKMFKERKFLYRHMQIHSEVRKYKCNICGFASKTATNANAHTRRHHKDRKQVGCEFCPKKFFTKTEAESHMRTHTGEKPFICSSCGLAFQTSGTLQWHFKRHFAPTDSCSYCEKQFWSEKELKEHMWIHTNEKLYSCTLCPRKFARYKSLQRHRKIRHP